jgi:hypothetical protein
VSATTRSEGTSERTNPASTRPRSDARSGSPEGGCVEETDRVVDEVDLTPAPDLEDLLERAEPSGQAEEGVGVLRHERLALVHSARDVQLVDVVGKNAERPELLAALDFMRAGDTLVVPLLERLSRWVLFFGKLANRLAVRLEDAVEPAQDREREDHTAVLVGAAGAPKLVSDRPDEATERAHRVPYGSDPIVRTTLPEATLSVRRFSRKSLSSSRQRRPAAQCRRQR